MTGSISTSTDADWFSFTANATGTVTVKVSMPGSADLDWYLYKSGSTSYLARGYTTSNPETGSFTLTSTGVYYVKVVGYSGATSSYTLNVSAPTGVIAP